MRNACKNLLKVDEYLAGLQEGRKRQDEAKLNAAITDLRDALNMLTNAGRD